MGTWKQAEGTQTLTRGLFIDMQMEYESPRFPATSLELRGAALMSDRMDLGVQTTLMGPALPLSLSGFHLIREESSARPGTTFYSHPCPHICGLLRGRPRLLRPHSPHSNHCKAQTYRLSEVR